MKNDWNTVSINDLKSSSSGSIAIGPFGSRMKSDCYVASGVPVIRGTNITGSGGLDGDFVYITEEKADSLGSSNVYKGDLVFPHRGSIGEVGIVQGDSRFVISSSLMKLTCDQSKVIPEYLYYFFKSHLGRHELLKNASQVGTPGIGQPLTSLKSIFVKIPQISEQKAITHILGSLDDKIELNRQINKTLEAMAQALFKSWFVDFDPVIDNALAAGNPIPDVFAERAKQRAAAKKPENQSTSTTAVNDSSNYQHLFPAEFEFTEEMGWIPLGWEVGLLGGFAIFGNGKKSPERSTGEIPVFGSNGMIGVCDEFNRDGTIIVGRVGSYCGSLQYYPSKCWITDNAMSAEMHDKECNIYLFQLLTRDNLNDRRAGSGQPLINQSILRSIVTVIPNKALIKEYSAIGNNLYKRKQSLSVSSQNLAKLRDTLLPKLLSGELRIPDAEKLVQEALL